MVKNNNLKKTKVSGGKNIRNAKSGFDNNHLFTLENSVDTLKKISYAKFDENVDIAINTCLDPKHSDQMLRGVVSMPNGTGKNVKIAVFAKDAKAEEARSAGADYVGNEDLINQIQKNEINFDVCVATPDMMGVVGKVAKILGPKGKMPNPKLGTVTNDLQNAINLIKSGQVEFKVEKNGIVHAGIAKIRFETSSIIENIRAFVDAVLKSKPAGAKGTYIKSIYLSSTMSPALKIDVSTVLDRN